MSLIADALRKAGVSSPLTPPPAPGQPPKARWIYAAFGIGCVGLALTLWARLPRRSPSVEFSVARETSTPAPASSQPIGLNLLRGAESQWRLNGIVKGGEGRSLALINGQVVEEGDPIRGARLIRVSQDQVDLEEEGELKTLQLR